MKILKIFKLTSFWFLIFLLYSIIITLISEITDNERIFYVFWGAPVVFFTILLFVGDIVCEIIREYKNKNKPLNKV
jgi:TM2 domain-containing membrane protein YozV